MELFRIKKDIPFMRHALIFNVISALTFVAAVFFLVQKGLHLSIEFTGGTVMEVGYTQTADVERVRQTVAGLGFADVQVQNFGTSRDVLIRLHAKFPRQDVPTVAAFKRICHEELSHLFEIAARPLPAPPAPPAASQPAAGSTS